MAITAVGSGTVQQVGSGTAMTTPLVASMAADDIMIVGLSTIDNVGLTGGTSGWTQIAGRNNGSSHRHEVWAKRHSGSESTPSFTRSGGGTGLSRMYALRGIDNATALTDLIETVQGWDSGGSSVTTATHPALDPVATYTYWTTFTSFGINASGAGTYAGSNPTYTNRWSNAGTTALAGQVMEDGENTDGANVAQRTKSVTSAPIIVHVIAWREDPLVTGTILRPDADTDVAGWTTSPLFSKINDVSDATFITDELV